MTYLWLVPIIIIFIIISIWSITVYNRLVALKHNVKESWSNIDVLLRQRNEELPKLVDVCQEYMNYERETFERITSLRSQEDQRRAEGDVKGISAIEGMLGGAINGLLARAEAYPDLKSNESFQRLMARVSALQDSISDRREFYNESVNINNIRREQFPDMIVARIFGFGPFSLFEIQESERSDVDMRGLFNR